MSQIGLPETFRFAIFNGTGISIASNTTPTISGRRVRFDTTGTLSFEAVCFTFLSLGTTLSIANNSYVVGSTWSNTASGWLGGEFHLSCFASGNASGTITLYMEVSPDGGTTWQTPVSANGPGGGILMTAAGFNSLTTASTASTTQRIAFEM